MPEYRHDQDRDEQVRATQRLRADGGPSPQAMLAAASGRTDVLSGSTVLALQRTAGNAGVGAMLEEERSPVHDVVGSGGGSPLPTDVRTDMETRLGADFGDVRVHTDDKAHDSARAVHAQAYTVGSDVVFQRGGYDPTSTAGRTTLAHELTHVVQQRSGPVDGAPAAGGIKVSDPSDRFEREASANAERAMSASPEPASAVSDAPAMVQREKEVPEEEEEVPESS
jgi:hypothetical protein